MDWNQWLLNHEMLARLGFFVGVFTLVAIWEWLAPKRMLLLPKVSRWANNLALVVLNTILLRLIFPMAAVGLAALSVQQDWGILNSFQVPPILAVVLAVVALDFVIYLQHVMMHAVPILWRLHRVHHADLDYDVTTGLRFHPIEIVLSMLIKFLAIVLLGPPVVAVIIFEVLLNATAMFNHGNIHLPQKFDRILRWFVVTPDMHRVHHSIKMNETNRNFGFNVPWWDRLLGTYQAQPEAGHTDMVIGVEAYRDPQQVDRLPGMLVLPFVAKAQSK